MKVIYHSTSTGQTRACDIDEPLIVRFNECKRSASYPL